MFNVTTLNYQKHILLSAFNFVMGGFKKKPKIKRSFYYIKRPIGFGEYMVLYPGQRHIVKGKSIVDYFGQRLIQEWMKMEDQMILYGY